MDGRDRAEITSVRFTVPGEPKGKGRPRFSPQTGHAYTPKETVNYESLVKFSYMSQCSRFRFPDDAQLRMVIAAYYSVPKSDSKKKRAAKLAGDIRPTKKPDMDNVVKVIADSLNQIAYRDDTQIVTCVVQKFYAEEPRVEVQILEITPGNPA